MEKVMNLVRTINKCDQLVNVCRKNIIYEKKTDNKNHVETSDDSKDEKLVEVLGRSGSR